MVDIARVREGFELLDKGMKVLGSGPLDYYLRRLTDCYELLIDRFAPHKVGDRVILTKTPKIDEQTSWGWLGSKHFLVKGAVGTVREVSCDGRGFGFQVEFDDETWLDGERKPQPVSKRSTYYFGEDYLVAARS